MRKRDTVQARTDDVWRRRYPKKRALAVNVLSFDDRAGTSPRPFRPIRFARECFQDVSVAFFYFDRKWRVITRLFKRKRYFGKKFGHFFIASLGFVSEKRPPYAS